MTENRMTKKNTTTKRILPTDIHDYIRVRGAAEHNLKHVNVKIPRDTLTVFTGLSGSGKSSLAFDTIFAEGQRRYMESLSSMPECSLVRWTSPTLRE
jgi:excinuclease ABC subunit A